MLKSFLRNFLIAVKGEETEFTKGSIRRAIFMLSVPMILEMVMESLFAVVDVFFVSKVGTDAVATVGLTESVIMIVYSISVGLSMATTAMVARRVGEKEYRAAADAGVQSIWLAVGISFAISIIGIIFPREILELMGASKQVIDSGFRYTQILIGGNISITLLFLINAIFRGAGNASIAMRALWIGNGANIILDPVFIFGLGPVPALGVEGAAWATTIGRGLGVVFQLYCLLRGTGIIRVLASNIKVIPDVIFRLLNVSLGGIGQYLIGTASWIFLVRIVSEFGSEAVAGYTIAFRLIIFTILPSWGMANAAATLVGQNLGAGFPERAEKSVWTTANYNLGFLIVLAVGMGFWAEPITLMFSTEPAVVQNSVISLRIISLSYVFFAHGMVVSQSFNGAGDTKTPTVVNFFAYWLIQIPLSYIFAITLDWGPAGVYVAVTISAAILAGIFIVVFRRGKWKQTTI